MRCEDKVWCRVSKVHASTDGLHYCKEIEFPETRVARGLKFYDEIPVAVHKAVCPTAQDRSDALGSGRQRLLEVMVELIFGNDGREEVQGSSFIPSFFPM